MPGEKRSHEDMEEDKGKTVVAAAGAAAAPAADGAAVMQQQSPAATNAGMLGLPFMLPSAALMAMNSVQQADQSAEDAAAIASQQMATAAAALAAATAQATAGEGGEKSDAQQQQMMQQQLQLLQMQQQHLQQMSPSELTTMAAMAHQMALGMVMMPSMMPLMMMNQGTGAAASGSGGQASPQIGQGSPSSRESDGASAAADSLGMIGQSGDAGSMPLMAAGAAYGMGNDDTPKRKRGRPPKKDVLARTKPEGGDKTLKQYPLWGYGMQLPFLPSFMANGAAAGAAGDQAGASTQDDSAAREEDDEANRQGKLGSKKKTRGTGKPRGRPRTRPRPGDVIHRVKQQPIAPANFPGMQEYLAQKMAEWKATQANAAISDDNRSNAFGAATLLPGDHE